jgi:hypothetical protein
MFKIACCCLAPHDMLHCWLQLCLDVCKPSNSRQTCFSSSCGPTKLGGGPRPTGHCMHCRSWLNAGAYVAPLHCCAAPPVVSGSTNPPWATAALYKPPNNISWHVWVHSAMKWQSAVSLLAPESRVPHNHVVAVSHSSARAAQESAAAQQAGTYAAFVSHSICYWRCAAQRLLLLRLLLSSALACAPYLAHAAAAVLVCTLCSPQSALLLLLALLVVRPTPAEGLQGIASPPMLSVGSVAFAAPPGQ